MAEEPGSIEKGVEELGEEITCAVCHDHYQDPKVLPCCHYYCMECVRRMAARQNPFPCPQCRKPATLPDNDPAKLPTAYFVNRVKDVHSMMEKARGKVEARCEMCAGARAVAFCRQCTDFICDDCVKSHEKMKVFSGHRVVSLEELREGGTKHIPPTLAPPMKCETHEEQLKMFCFDCNVLICRDCTVIDHAGHNFEFVKKSVGQCREKMREGLQPLLKIQSDINTIVKCVGERKKAISEQGRDVTAHIKTTFDYLRQLLSRHEEKLEKEVSDVVEQKLSTLTGQEKNLHLALAEVQSVSDFVRHNIESATDEELMSIHKQIENSMEEQHQKVAELDQEPAEETDVCDQISIANELQQVSAEIAPNISKCVVEGPGIELAELQKATHVTVHTVLKDDHPCITIQQVEAELRSLVDGSVIKIHGESTGQGNYQLAYTPLVRGRHDLNITVNDQPITGSPFRVFVRVHPTQIGKTVRSIKVVKKPFAVAVMADKKIVVSIPDAKRVLFLSKNGEELDTITCDGEPTGVAVDDNGHVYVALYNTNCLCKFSQDGKKLKETKSELNNPGEVAIINNIVFVCNRGSHNITVFTRELEFIREFGSSGSGDGQFGMPRFIAQDAEGKLWITDYYGSCVYVFTFDGQFQRVVQKPADKGKLDSPQGIVCDSEFVYVTERDSNCVSVFTVSGDFVTSIGLGNSNPRGIAIDQDGFLYVCYYNRQEFKVY